MKNLFYCLLLWTLSSVVFAGPYEFDSDYKGLEADPDYIDNHS